VINALRKLRQRLRLGSLDRGDFSGSHERPLDNVDALAESLGGRDPADNIGDSQYPPGYVKSYDEGRPRK